RAVAQVERLDRDALGRDPVAVPFRVHDRAETRHERLERGGPVVLGTQQQSDQVRGLRHQQKRGRWWASWARHHGQSWATSYPHTSSSQRSPFACSCPAKRRVLSSAPVVSSHCPCPQTSSTLSRPRSHSRWSPSSPAT